uniref:Uncharacterized protein n=1 Tax=Glossina pallidipes TaxID=7398 RepID=A0A1A9ZYR4_GLOPL
MPQITAEKENVSFNFFLTASATFGIYYKKITSFKMETNSVSPLPPLDAPLAMMENEKTPPGTPSVTDMPPPPDEKVKLPSVLTNTRNGPMRLSRSNSSISSHES